MTNFFKGLLVRFMLVALVALSACRRDRDDAALVAEKVFGKVPTICQKINEGFACKEVCGGRVLFCPLEDREECYYRRDIDLIVNDRCVREPASTVEHAPPPP